MRSGLILFLCLLLSSGVFAADVEPVSVMEGDSVTLHADAKIQIKTIDWKLGDLLIASVDAEDSDTSVDLKGVFGGRLQLDSQTGDLKITNITNSDSGLYQLKINSKELKTFSVSVVASADRDAVTSVSVQVGDSVTLNTEIQKDDVIRWRFELQNSPIVEINRKARNVSTHDGPDGRFKDKLKADYLTGSLTIRNIGMNHAGLYVVDISRSGYTIHKTFSVTVTVSDAVKSVSGTEGESVTLNTGLTKIQTDDEVQWMFRGTTIAEINKENKRFYSSDVRFGGRLKVDDQTGSLTIKNTRNTDSGDYEVTIRGSKHTVLKRIHVTITAVPGSGLSAGAVAGIVVGVMLIGVLVVAGVMIYYRYWISKLERLHEIETDAVRPDDYLTITVTEVQREDQMQWKFNGTPIAQIKGGTTEILQSAADGIFRDRLELEPTGSLTIKKMRPTDDGDYLLYNTKTGRKIKSFRVKVRNPGDNGDNPEGMPLTHFYFH